ncbi:MAG: hypothetical protein Tsb002_01650 [Wenzhouxiangellaceae bacterium]
MLLLTRRANEAFQIDIAPDADSQHSLAQAFADGPIKVRVMAVGQSHIKLGIEAPRVFRILRCELTASE